MSSGCARCNNCKILIKLEPCEECECGYFPQVCPSCEGDFEIDYLPIKEEK